MKKENFLNLKNKCLNWIKEFFLVKLEFCSNQLKMTIVINPLFVKVNMHMQSIYISFLINHFINFWNKQTSSTTFHCRISILSNQKHHMENRTDKILLRLTCTSPPILQLEAKVMHIIIYLGVHLSSYTLSFPYTNEAKCSLDTV